MSNPTEEKMGVSGRLAAAFQSNAITPLLALVALMVFTGARLPDPTGHAYAAVVAHDRLRVRVSATRDTTTLLQALEEELQGLVATPLEHIETTLLVAPFICPDFLDFNDLVGQAQDALVHRRDGDLGLLAKAQARDLHRDLDRGLAVDLGRRTQVHGQLAALRVQRDVDQAQRAAVLEGLLGAPAGTVINGEPLEDFGGQVLFAGEALAWAFRPPFRLELLLQQAAAIGVGLLAAALVMVLVALNVLAAAIVAGLTEMGLHPGWAALIVALLFLVAAAVMAKSGKAALEPSRLAPTRTARNLKRDVETVKEATNDTRR